MLNLNNRTGKSTKPRALSADTDSVKIEGGNAVAVDVEVKNLPADAAKETGNLQALKLRADLLSSEATAQAILAALVDQITQHLLVVKTQQTDGTQKTEVSNFPAVQPVSNAAMDAMASALGTTADPAFAGGPNGTVPALLKGVIAALGGTLKTESLALPLPNGAATEVTMQSLLKATQNAASSVWVDDSGTHYIQRQVVDPVTGVTTVSYTDAQGNPATPGAGLKPFGASGGTSSSISFESYWTAKVAAAEYVQGQTLAQFSVFDTSTTPATKIMSAWVNLSTGNTLTAPPPNTDIEAQANNVTVSNVVEVFANALPLPTGAASEASLQAIVSCLVALGAIGDVAWTGVGNGSQISIAKAIHALQKAQSDVLGTTADAEWSGVGAGTVNSVSKNIASSLKGAAVTGVAMPAGGGGLMGWLSAIYKQLSSGISNVALPAKTIKVFGYTLNSNNSTLYWANSIKSASFTNRGNIDAMIFDFNDAATKLNPITLPAGETVSFQASPGETYAGFVVDAQGTIVTTIVERAI